MTRRIRLGALVAAIVTVLSMTAVAVMPASAAAVVFDVANDHATCNTLSGTITSATTLKATNPSTGPNTLKIAGTLAGRGDDDNGAIKMFKGTMKATVLTNTGTNCEALFGLHDVTATLQIVWAPALGQKFTPTELVGTVQKATSDVSFSQLAVSVLPVTDGPWSTAYGKYATGSPYGTTALSNTVDFTGGDGGSTGWLDTVVREDANNLFNQCNTGSKTLHFGIGGIHIG